MAGEASAVLAGNTAGPCPTCGGIGKIPDGFYRLIDETLRVTAASGYSQQQVARVIEVLRAAQNGPPDVAAVAQALHVDAPEVAAVLRRLLVPKNAGEFYALLGILLAALGLFLGQHAAGGQPAPATDITVTAIVEVTNQQCPTVPNSPKRAEPPGPAQGGPHRPSR